MFHEREAENESLKAQRNLVRALCDPACYPHPVGRISLIETHISFVVLTGSFAYKIKKSVDLGFLDFTTLEKRQWSCREELRLNARLAAQIYLDVVPIGGTREAPRMGSGAQAIEYAVKMIEFPQDALADRVLARDGLMPGHVDALAALVAKFHAGAACSHEADRHGAPEIVFASAEQNFAQIRALPAQAAHLPVLDALEAWTRREQTRLLPAIARRKREGRVRECHGDLHLGNIVFLDDKPLAFDCIEFNPELRWIDVMNEVAFLVMDLLAAGRGNFSARFLNAYLEATGDYGDLSVLRYYLVYRALVRAKIAAMRAEQLQRGSEGLVALETQCRDYLALAESLARVPRGFVAITHGLSGSGKTTLTQPFLEMTGAIRIRSDVERKRIRGMAPRERSAEAIGAGLYAPDATTATYGRLLDLAQNILDAGYGVIVDATFLEYAKREMFRRLAAQAGVPFAIIDFGASPELLRDRVLARSERADDASDADLAVLEHQLAAHQPLRNGELANVFAYDASRPADVAGRPQTWARLLQRLSLPPA